MAEIHCLVIHCAHMNERSHEIYPRQLAVNCARWYACILQSKGIASLLPRFSFVLDFIVPNQADNSTTMTPSLIEIDPDGDVIIVLVTEETRSLNPASESAESGTLTRPHTNIPKQMEVRRLTATQMNSRTPCLAMP